MRINNCFCFGDRITSLKKAVEEKIQILRADFKSMLCEKAMITSSSRWSRVSAYLNNKCALLCVGAFVV